MVEPAVASAGPLLPSPPDNLNILVKRAQWIRSRPIHRVHHQQFAADAFNPGVKGNARFSPIRDSAGRPIPTLYGGTSMACAAMETVFHDVPFAPGLKTYDRSKLESQRYSVLEAQRDLMLADLSNVPLRKLGIGRSQLIGYGSGSLSVHPDLGSRYPRAVPRSGRPLLGVATARPGNCRHALRRSC